MEKIIEELRANGKEIIDWIVRSYDILCGDDDNYVKNDFIVNKLDYLHAFCNDKYKRCLDFIELDEEYSIPVINEYYIRCMVRDESLKILKEKLLNNVMSFDDLDNLLEDNGYFGMFEYSKIEKDANQFNVVYKAANHYHYDLEVTFILGVNAYKKMLNDEFKAGEKIYVKITDVQKKLRESSVVKMSDKELRRILLGYGEMNFMLLNRILADNGYYSVLDEGIPSYIKKKSKAVYHAEDTGKAEIEISFEITENSGPDEIEESFWIEVTDIKRI